MYAANEIWLPPPQYYELSRLCQINDIDKVVEFAKARNNEGITLHYPIYYEATDGAVLAYPGEIAFDLVTYFPIFIFSFQQP